VGEFNSLPGTRIGEEKKERRTEREEEPFRNTTRLLTTLDTTAGGAQIVGAGRIPEKEGLPIRKEKESDKKRDEKTAKRISFLSWRVSGAQKRQGLGRDLKAGRGTEKRGIRAAAQSVLRAEKGSGTSLSLS